MTNDNVSDGDGWALDSSEVAVEASRWPRKSTADMIRRLQVPASVEVLRKKSFWRLFGRLRNRGYPG